MVILDTNVISELVKPKPDARVVAWADTQQANDLHTTCITKAELFYGVEKLPSGQKRSALAARYGSLFGTFFMGRTLPFDEMSAEYYARLAASALRRGANIATEDIQIAAIAWQYRCPVATRNTSHFDHEAIEVINPWVV